jgi:putative PIN family toxin of toxin-antitoxin system
MLRLFVDSNVLFSGLLFRGQPHELLRAAVEGRFTAVVSETVLAEADRAVAAKFGCPRGSVPLALRLLGAELVPDAEVADPERSAIQVRDPSDVAIVAAALAAGVDALVTGDKDILSAADLPVRVVTVRQALTLIGQAAQTSTNRHDL